MNKKYEPFVPYFNLTLRRFLRGHGHEFDFRLARVYNFKNWISEKGRGKGG